MNIIHIKDRSEWKRTRISSSMRVTLSIGLIFCHSLNHIQLRSCMYLRRLRCTTQRAILSTGEATESAEQHGKSFARKYAYKLPDDICCLK